MNNGIRVLGGALLLGGAVAAFASNAPGAVQGLAPRGTLPTSLTNVVSFEDSCGGVSYSATLNFTGSTNDGGGQDQVWFQIYDDGIEKTALNFSAPVGQSRSFAINVEYPGGVSQAAPGIGVYVREVRGNPNTNILVYDPYYPSQLSTCSIGARPPSITYDPLPGVLIVYGASGTAPDIRLFNAGGGSGTGPAATTTITNCTITGGGAAFPTSAFNPNISVVGAGLPSTLGIALPHCVPQPAAVTATLSCREDNGGGSFVQNQAWSVRCPGGGAPPPSSGPSVSLPAIESAALGGGVPNAASREAVIARNASKLAFTSDASDLVAGDGNGRADIFVRNRATGQTTRVSAAAEALNPGAGESFSRPFLSADGSRVVFVGSSGQAYFVPDGGVARRISASAAGAIANGASGKPMVAADGVKVVFESVATNLLTTVDGNGSVSDIFLKDMNTGAVTLVSKAPNGGPADGPSTEPRVSDDGQLVYFTTLAANLTSGAEANAVKEASVRQIAVVRGGGLGSSATYVSRNPSTNQAGNGDSTNMSATPDGRYGVFESLATNLVANDTNGVADIFRFEVAGGQLVSLTRVSVTKTGAQANGASRNATISADGRVVTFETDATNLVTPDTNNASDVIVKLIDTGDILRQSGASASQEPNGASTKPSISGDGSTVAYGSGASNLIPNDTNNAADVFSSSVRSPPQDEPRLAAYALPTPEPANANCPSGFFSVLVDDGADAGLTAGAFGMEVLLDEPGTRVLAGGLNFGGLIDVGQVGFAGFTIANAANEAQRLNLSLTGSPASSSTASLSVRVRIARRTATTSDSVFETTATVSLAAPLVTSIDLPPGFYEATVAPTSGSAGGASEGQFYFSLTTSFVNRPGGGFQGGAVVGGYHAAHPFGGVSGFAAFCLATPHTTTIRVLSQPSYGATGAKDLRLRIRDAQQRDLVTVPLAASGGSTPGNAAPTANFTVSTNGLTANFTDASSDSDGTIAARNWSFGDGGSSTATNPSRTYAAANTYTVTLTVTDNLGATASVSRQVTVAGGGSTTQLLNGVTVSGATNSTSPNSSFADYLVVIPPQSANLNIATSSATADLDLYVRFGAVPNLGQYDCRPFLFSGNESCLFSIPSAGTYYIRVYGYATGAQSFRINASWTTNTGDKVIRQLQPIGM